jgi:hypothetical protein
VLIEMPTIPTSFFSLPCELRQKIIYHAFCATIESRLNRKGWGYFACFVGSEAWLGGLCSLNGIIEEDVNGATTA